MDYTSPTTARMSEPRSGASCRAVVEISECNSYMPQRLDSLRRDLFLFKWYSLNYHKPSGDWRSVIQHASALMILFVVPISCLYMQPRFALPMPAAGFYTSAMSSPTPLCLQHYVSSVQLSCVPVPLPA